MPIQPDFPQLPGYRSTYQIGENVFFLPMWSECSDPVHGIVTERTGESYHVMTASGEKEAYPSDMRPGNTQTLVAWLKMIEQSMTGEYAVTMVIISPEEAQNLVA